MVNEIFGEMNRVGLMSRVTKTASNNGTYFASSVDYILCYAKAFAESLDVSSDVAVYVKLPDGFYISTPVGHYNPD